MRPRVTKLLKILFVLLSVYTLFAFISFDWAWIYTSKDLPAGIAVVVRILYAITCSPFILLILGD